jgi:hypothetical protein
LPSEALLFAHTPMIGVNTHLACVLLFYY